MSIMWRWTQTVTQKVTLLTWLEVKINNRQMNMKIENLTEYDENLNCIAQNSSDCLESDIMEDDLAVSVKNQKGKRSPDKNF